MVYKNLGNIQTYEIGFPRNSVERIKSAVENRLRFAHELYENEYGKCPRRIEFDESAYQAIFELCGGDMGFALAAANGAMNYHRHIMPADEGLPHRITAADVKGSGLTAEAYKAWADIGKPKVITFPGKIPVSD